LIVPAICAPRRLHAAVVILWRFLLHPSNEGCDVFMRLQGFPRVVASRQLFLCERGVNFSVANAVDRVRLAAALAFGQQVVLINAFACDKLPAAERASAQGRFLMTQRPLAAQRPFSNHFPMLLRTKLAASRHR
jgi:hypothetical protein